MANKSGKQKIMAFRPPAQILSANLSNSTFGFLPASGSKGKSPAFPSGSVHVQPDLDLISGFAFLSFATLGQLETHIEHNEPAKCASVSVDVGQKRKAESSIKPQGNSSELYCPPNKKKTVSAKKKTAKKTSGPLTSDLAAKPKESTLLCIDKDGRERFQAVETDVCGRGSEMLQQSPNADLEISLLCSETVDSGDEEEILQQEGCGTSMNAFGNRDTWGGFAASFSTHVNEDVGVVEGSAMTNDSKPKKKKKKKKSQHCDQTSQTKFRIKKKKKPVTEVQDLEGSCNMAVNELKTGKFSDTAFQDVDNSSFKDGELDDDKKAQTKTSLSRPKFERTKCARTSIYQVPNRGSYFKSRILGSVLSSSSNNSAVELPQMKNDDKSSLDGCMPNISDREIDVGDDTRSVSMLSDFSDHSSDIEFFDPNGCFLLNSKIDKVEKEEFLEGEEIVDVDVETVGKDTKKNFLVVSGVEAGHFSYHPGMTKEGTIDTSIQAYPNEIDIFLQCAKMQEGHMIKIINPDDSYELHSHFTQKNGRDPNTVKATRSATERKRRHHLGDLFRDLKVEVFTDIYESDLYFSKQAILSKAIDTLEELKKELSDLTNAKVQMLKQNKTLKEKRNTLMFGKVSVDVDDAKVEAILKDLNIDVDDVHEECLDDGVPQEKEDATNNQESASESNVVVVEPSAKGRPRVNKNILPPWLLKPSLKNKDDLSKSTANVARKSGAQCVPETPKVIQTGTSSIQSSPSEGAFNVSCGVQTLAVESGSSKSSGLENSTLAQMLLGNNEVKSAPLTESTRWEGRMPSLTESSSKVIHTVTSTSSQGESTAKITILPVGGKTQEIKTDSAKSCGSKTSPQSQPLLTDNITLKNTSVDQLLSQEVPKPSLVKILPKPAILHLNPSQQKAFMESLGQIKQPSSDKIICNLSRLSTQPNTSTPSRICIIRSGQLMKSLDSKNVMHIKLTNDTLKNLDTSGNSAGTAPVTSTVTEPSSDMKTEPGVNSLGKAPDPRVSSSTAHIPSVAGAQKPVVPTSAAQIFATAGGQKPIHIVPTSTTHFLSVAGGQKPVVLTSTPQISLVPGAQKPVIVLTSAAQNILSVSGSQKPIVLTSTPQIPSVPGSQKPVMLTSSAQNIPSVAGAQKRIVPTSTPQVVSLTGGDLKPEVRTAVTQLPQKHSERTVLLSKIPLTTTKSTPKVVFGGQQLNLIPATSIVQGLPSTSQASPDVALRALASLNQLQANKPAPPLTGTVGDPLVPNENPVAGCLIGLKNVVMKVGSAESEVQSTTPQQAHPIISMTTSLKPAATSQISVTSSSSHALKEKCGVSSLCSTVSASPVTSSPSSMLLSLPVPSSTSPVISVPSSTALNTSFTMSPAISVPSSTLPEISVPSRKVPVISVPSSTSPSISIPSTVISLPSSTSLNTSFTMSSAIPVPSSTSPGTSVTSAVLPVISVPSSTSLNTSFTMSPAISVPPSTSPGLPVPSTTLPVISVPSSTSLNTSFTMSTVSDPVSSSGTSISCVLDTIVPPLIDPCLDPFNFIPEQLAAPTPTVPSELSSSLRVEKESGSTESLSLGLDVFKPETSSSSTVLTQEMLKIPGIQQNPEVSSMLLNPPELPLADVFPDLAEIDTLIMDTVIATEPSCNTNKEIPDGSGLTGSGSLVVSEKQSSLPTYSLRSSSVDANKTLASPLKKALKDSKKGKPYQFKP